MSRPASVLRAAAGKPCPWCETTMVITEDEANGHPPDIKTNPHFPTREHIIPRRLMPAWVPGQMPTQRLLIICARCNVGKGGRTLWQWIRFLKTRRDPRAEIVEAWVAANPDWPVTVHQINKPSKGASNGRSQQGDADRVPREGPGGPQADERQPGGEPPDGDFGVLAGQGDG